MRRQFCRGNCSIDWRRIYPWRECPHATSRAWKLVAKSIIDHIAATTSPTAFSSLRSILTMFGSWVSIPRFAPQVQHYYGDGDIPNNYRLHTALLILLMLGLRLSHPLTLMTAWNFLPREIWELTTTCDRDLTVRCKRSGLRSRLLSCEPTLLSFHVVWSIVTQYRDIQTMAPSFVWNHG